ncbi:MAG: prephenate dehydrogenase/arogenate dehydrogenase family protein [Firmicutes bacterium]|nr:prephenate dehydrogenase/arogenate dehydrogenase family protein [Bacillota bacterium]
MKIGVIGLGLIGGSIAKAWRSKGYEVYGYDNDHDSVAAAMADGVIEAVWDWRQWLPRIDHVAVATPVAAVGQWIRDITTVGRERPGVLVDISSVKSPILPAMQQLSPPWQAVSLHPMAGSELRGYAASRADLFSGFACAVIVEDLPPAPGDVVKQWMQVLEMYAEPVAAGEHDAMVAAVSHLPYIISASLLVAVNSASPSAGRLAGPGFRDTTRVGASDPGLWDEILRANRSEVQKMLAHYQFILEQCQDDLSQGRFPAMLRDCPNIRRHLVHEPPIT